MEKQEGSGEGKTRKVLEGIELETDYKIECEVQEDGSVRYFHPNDEWNQEPVKGESLYEVIMVPIRRVKALAELLDDDDRDRFGFIAEGIAEEAERLYGEVFHFLDDAVGEIEIDLMGRNSVVYRTGRVLDARITPPKGVAEVIMNELNKWKQKFQEAEEARLLVSRKLSYYVSEESAGRLHIDPIPKGANLRKVKDTGKKNGSKLKCAA